LILLICILALLPHLSAQPAALPEKQPQLAARGNLVVMTYGVGDNVFFKSSTNGGITWGTPIPLPANGKLSLGMRRGPRIAISRNSIVVSAILGEKGRGADGDLIVWRSTDNGQHWSHGRVLNDVPGSAREGLHSMAGDTNGTILAAWLDLREKGTTIYGAVSTDGGASWSPNRLIYKSPSGSVCECCHPSAFVGSLGHLSVMFRNAVDGNRDMYVVRSTDGGLRFGPAEKLGTASWQLNACPMDGGGFTVQPDGGLVAVWRRQGNIYLSTPGAPERRLGSGRQPVVVSNAKGAWIAWTDGTDIRWTTTHADPIHTIESGAAFLSLVPLANGAILLAGERDGRIVTNQLPAQ